MAISKIQHYFYQQRDVEKTLQLREGQIIEGKILKLYPDDKAKVRIGSTTLIAQLETALRVGESYYFQVSESNEQIYLQVVQTEGKNNTANIEALLQQLQIKPTKFNRQFVHNLITSGIPFNRAQLEQAIHILQDQSDKTRALDILQQMMQRKLPIINSVFEAMTTFHTNQFTSLLDSVYQAIQQSSTPLSDKETTFMQLLQPFLQQSERININVSQTILHHIEENPSSIMVYRMLGLLDVHGNQNEILTRLQHYIQTKDMHDFPLQYIQHDDEFSQVLSQAKNEINTLLQQESAIVRTTLKVMSIFHPLQTNTLNNQQFNAMIKMIENELLPLLPKQMGQRVAQQLQHASIDKQATMLSMLRAISSQEVFSQLAQMEQLLSQQQTNNHQSLPVQQQFLAQLTHYLESLGLSMEHDVMQALQAIQDDGTKNIPQMETIKSLLVQMLQQHTKHQEPMQQLVHFINGLQLQSLTETNNMLQAHLLIPGRPFALNEDMFIQFESKKTNDDQIDADYCRIMFVLDLAHLQETIVDMQVQKRIITVTIYNDVFSRVETMHTLEKQMKDNLEQLQYQLSSVHWKPLSERDTQEFGKPVQKTVPYQQEGFDFRI